MSGRFLVRPLGLDRIRRAFPIISMLEPEISYEDWRDYAEANLAGADAGLCQGMIAIENEQGHILGLSTYRLGRDLRRRRILFIENFAVVGLFGSRRAARGLLQELEVLGRKHGCDCLSLGLLNARVRASLRDAKSPPVDFFSHLGFQAEPVRHRKCF